MGVFEGFSFYRRIETITKTAKQPQKSAHCQVLNWSKYNESLVSRGDITLWFEESITENWRHDNIGRKVGRPFLYSDSTIECLLILKAMLGLTYRQAEGFGRALMKLAGLELPVPDYTSLAKRDPKLELPIDAERATGPIDLVVDSTGLKVFGEGEWKVRQHGADGRRTWRKIHLAVDPDTPSDSSSALDRMQQS